MRTGSFVRVTSSELTASGGYEEARFGDFEMAEVKYLMNERAARMLPFCRYLNPRMLDTNSLGWRDEIKTYGSIPRIANDLPTDSARHPLDEHMSSLLSPTGTDQNYSDSEWIQSIFFCSKCNELITNLEYDFD